MKYLYLPAKNSHTRARVCRYLARDIKLRLYVYKSEKMIASYTHLINPVNPAYKVKVSFLTRIFDNEL